MPRPVEGRGRYVPAFDGIRAIAVLAVLAYHLRLPGFSGGLLGVAVFFTLSGYLITGLLLAEWRRGDREDGDGIRLGQFWLRRIRRLVPAVVSVLAVVLAVTAATNRTALGDRTGEAVSALLYVNNWWVIQRGRSYFDLFSGPAPLDHLWSLSIEEQFYVGWPLLLALLLLVARGRTRLPALVASAGALASFAWMWHLATAGLDNTRAYEGTDTRVGGILVGAVVACLVAGSRDDDRRRREGPGALAQAAAAAGLAGVVAVVLTTTDTGLGVFRWGIAAVSVATVVLAAAVDGRRGVVASLLGSAPLRWVGVRSYGIYLWHMPAVALIPRGELPLWAWALVVTGFTLAVSELSWTLLEDPIRRHGFRAALGLRGREGADRRRRPAATPAAQARDARTVTPAPRRVPALPVLATAGVAGLVLGLPAATAGGAAHPAAPLDTTMAISTGGGEKGPSEAADVAVAPEGTNAVVDPVAAGYPPAPGVQPLATSCSAVQHIGDSTSIGLMSENYLPDPQDRVDAQYRKVGVKDVRTDISGARSSVEGFEDQPNSTVAIQSHVAAGFQGCWVTAMGTNDSANVQAGSEVGLRDRVDRTMQAVGDAPVLWLTLRTKNPTNDYYAEAGMERMNDEIRAACARYPKMRVYDWAAQVDPKWYIADGIHFTSEGYKERGMRIARALATAFPADAPAAPTCVVLPR